MDKEILPFNNLLATDCSFQLNDQVSTEFLNAFIRSSVRYARAKNQIDIFEAWKLFRVWQESRLDPESEDWNLFLSWYVFHWRTWGANREDFRPVAERYLNSAGGIFSPEEIHLIKGGLKTSLDFYEVYELEDLGFYYVKSLLLGYQYGYRFDKLPADLSVGDIFFGKFVHIIDDRGILLAKSKAFSADAKVAIGQLRVNLIRNRRADFAKDFSTFDSDIFNVYFDLLS